MASINYFAIRALYILKKFRPTSISSSALLSALLKLQHPLASVRFFKKKCLFHYFKVCFQMIESSFYEKYFAFQMFGLFRNSKWCFIIFLWLSIFFVNTEGCFETIQRVENLEKCFFHGKKLLKLHYSSSFKLLKHL